MPHSFDTLKHVVSKNRPDAATEIYKKHFRHVEEKLAMQCFEQLTAIARELNDKALESTVFDFRADYYSVNRGFNKLSILYYQQAIDFAGKNDLLLQEAIYLQHEAMFYFNNKHNPAASLLFLKAHEKFKKVGFDKVPNMSYYYS